MIDLKNASRDELIRLIVSQHETISQQEGFIAAQQERIATLEATVAQLTARVGELLAALAAIREETPGGTGRPPGMPGLKPATGMGCPPKKARKRREQQFVRHRMEPTVRVIHALDACPTCGVALVGGSVKRRREVIEVPLVPAVVTEHVWCCPRCHTRHTPAVALGEAVVGKLAVRRWVGQPDRDVARGSATAGGDDSVVSADVPCALGQRRAYSFSADSPTAARASAGCAA